MPNYSGVVKQFAAATADAQAALTGLNETATHDYKEFLKSRILSTSGSNLERVDKECRTASARCGLEILSKDPETDGERFPPEPILDDLVELISHISAYAGALDALANDQSAAETESNVNVALGNIQNLATTLRKLGQDGSATVPGFAAPVSSAIYWVIGKYADNVKIRGLRHATHKADPVIHKAAQYFASARGLAARIKATRFSKVLKAELKALSGENGLTEPNIDHAVMAAKKFDDFLRANHNAVFQRLASAHNALARSFNERDESFTQLFANIDNFAKSAQELAQIVKDLAELRSNRGRPS